jgi:cytochrome c oxidase subunit IV
MIYAYFTLFVALTISCVAEYYSIIGLTTIFSAAFWPVVIMGVALAVGKITAAVWLKLNWHRAPLTYKLYLIPAVIFLMFLTSVGCFGFLSKAHTDQSLVSGDVTAKIAIYDEKIKIAKENIDANRKALKQLDEAVDQVMGRSTDEKGADKAVAIRRNQSKERARLIADIEAEQKKITSLNEEAAPIRSEVRKVEAEVGPLKYIAAVIYGDNPDANLLEAAVRWVIILIVLVFDPLALVLILAAQQSMRWEREEELKREQENIKERELKEFFDGARERARQLDQEEDARKLEEAELKLAEANEQMLQERQTAATYEQDDGPITPAQIEQIQASVPEPIVKRARRAKIKTVLPDIEKTEVEPEVKQEIEAEVKQETKAEPEPEIDTKVTKEKVMFSPDVGYVWWEGKQTSIEALRGMRPDLILPAGDKLINKFNHAREFPQEAVSGDLLMRTDLRPHRLYKFNGVEWIHVSKEQNTSYLGNREYIQFLINSLNSGQYLPEMLTEQEEEEIWRSLNQQSSTYT